MAEKPRVLLSMSFCAVLMASSPAFSQSVNELTGPSVTPEKLIAVLTPKQGPPAANRGLTFVAPTCRHFRKAADRGIVLTPKADIAALTLEFETGSAMLTSSDEKVLATLGEALGSATLKPCCFEIQGYTDSVGRPAYNKRLSQRRAQAVAAYLADHNSIERDRMIPRGFGMSQPLASNATAEGRARNRRVQIVNLGYATDSAK
jgi:outer membrane protein OmpA-like peptidoglycan-associated protein